MKRKKTERMGIIKRGDNEKEKINKRVKERRRMGRAGEGMRGDKTMEGEKKRKKG